MCVRGGSTAPAGNGAGAGTRCGPTRNRSGAGASSPLPELVVLSLVVLPPVGLLSADGGRASAVGSTKLLLLLLRVLIRTGAWLSSLVRNDPLVRSADSAPLAPRPLPMSSNGSHDRLRLAARRRP